MSCNQTIRIHVYLRILIIGASECVDHHGVSRGQVVEEGDVVHLES